MKILFLRDDKGMFARFAERINALTDHEALQWEPYKKAEDGSVLPCPMSDPDIIIRIGSGCTMYEDEQAMGIVSRPRKRGLYIIGAPKSRGGMYQPLSHEWLFNDFWATQCIADKDSFPNTWRDDEDFWLPLPVTFESSLPAPTPPNELTMGIALSQFAASGVWDKGVVAFYTAHRASNCKLDIIMRVNRATALQRKAACSVIFDSDKGNIGVSGLESMAQGLPVLAKLDPRQIDCFNSLGADFPVITWTDQADLNDKLTYYKTHLEELAAIGAASKAWMEANYTNQAITDKWCNKLIEVCGL